MTPPPGLWWNDLDWKDAKPADVLALRQDATALWSTVRMLKAAIESRAGHDELADSVRAASKNLTLVERRYGEPTS